MSREVYTDDKPELWDELYEKASEDSIIKTKIADYKTNYIRQGKCNKCGCCCYVHDKDGKLVPCKYLKDNGDGTYDCTVYGTELMPNVCKLYPQKDNSYKCTKCGYYWIEKT